MTDPAPAPPSAARRADRLIAAACGLGLLTILFYAGDNWSMVIYRLLTDGLLAILWVAAAFGWGGLLVYQRKAAPQPFLLPIVTAAGLGLGGLSLAFLLLGLAGALNFWTVLLLLAVGLVLAALRLFLHRRRLLLPPLSTRWHWLWLAVIPFISMSFMAALVPPGILWRGEPNGYDVVEYHLQVPREWYELGKIAPLEHNVFSYMPMNVEMHYLAAMELRGGPWAGMYLAQLLHMAFIVLTILAIYAFSAPAGGGADPASSPKQSAAPAILAATAAALVPWMSLLAPIAYNEGGLLLFGALSLGWAMKALRPKAQTRQGTEGVEPGPTSSPSLCLLLSGLFAGFACGTKLTAVPMILVAVPLAWIIVWGLARLRSAPNPKPQTRNPIPPLLLFAAAGLLTFCPWLIRNQFWAHNPVYPELMPLLGANHFSPAQVQRYQKAHSPRPDQRSLSAHLAAAWNQIVADWAYGYLLLPIGLLAGLIALRKPEAIFLWLMLCALALIWIAFTHLQGRFFILAIPVLALMIAQVRWGHWQWLLALLILAGGAPGFRALNIQLLPWLEPDFVGLENFHGFLEGLAPPEAVRKIDAGQSLALVGDARAFLYPIPMNRLHYRTVFDVAAAPDQDLIQAWLGGARADLILVDPNELRRLTRTYYGLPPVPPKVTQHDQPFLWDSSTR